MPIKVKFFARLRDDAGLGEKDIPYQQGMTLADAWRGAGARGDMPDNALVAINMEYVRGQVSIKDGDEVAFFPAVTGG